MDNTKYSQEKVEAIFSEHGLTVLDTYTNTKTPLHCIDADGYEYSKRLEDLLNNKGYKRVHRGNPYSIQNIKRYLIKCESTLTFLEKQYTNSTTKMLFKCECGRLFYTAWNDIVRGKKYCNFCAKSKRFDDYRDYTKEIKNYCEYKDYILLTPNIRRCFDKFEYVCKKHEDKGSQYSNYDQMINSNRGCYYCGVERRGESQRLDESVYKKATEDKGFVYVGCNYNNEYSKYKKVNIEYICPHHKSKGIQTIKYSNLLKSNGRCWYCAGHDRTKNDLQNELDALHGTIKVLEYKNYSSPILVQCNVCGHMWSTSGVNLTQGRRCPKCTKSNFAIDVSRLLNTWGYKHTLEYWFDDCRDINPLPFDFYLNDFNILIEADGEGHFSPVKFNGISEDLSKKVFKRTCKHDQMKTEYCNKNHIPLIRIPYWERDNLEYFLWDELAKVGAIKEIAI